MFINVSFIRQVQKTVLHTDLQSSSYFFERQQETTGSFLITHCMPWWVQCSYYQLCLRPWGTVAIPSALLPKALSLQDGQMMSYSDDYTRDFISLNTSSLAGIYCFICAVNFLRAVTDLYVLENWANVIECLNHINKCTVITDCKTQHTHDIPIIWPSFCYDKWSCMFSPLTKLVKSVPLSSVNINHCQSDMWFVLQASWPLEKSRPLTCCSIFCLPVSTKRPQSVVVFII